MGENIDAQLERTVKELAVLSDGDLDEELGRRLVMTKTELGTQEALSTARPLGRTEDTAGTMGPGTFLRDLAKAFMRRLNHSLYALVCDTTDPDNAKVRSALDKGTDALGYAIAGALAVSFGMLPAIAGVVGTILAKRLASSSHGAVCDAWKKQL